LLCGEIGLDKKENPPPRPGRGKRIGVGHRKGPRWGKSTEKGPRLGGTEISHFRYMKRVTVVYDSLRSESSQWVWKTEYLALRKTDLKRGEKSVVPHVTNLRIVENWVSEKGCLQTVGESKKKGQGCS